MNTRLMTAHSKPPKEAYRTYFLLSKDVVYEYVKIGKAINVKKRISELGSGSAFGLRLLGVMMSNRESELHETFRLDNVKRNRYGLSRGGVCGHEWFNKTTPLIEFIGSECEYLTKYFPFTGEDDPRASRLIYEWREGGKTQLGLLKFRNYRQFQVLFNGLGWDAIDRSEKVVLKNIRTGCDEEVEIGKVRTHDGSRFDL